MMIKWVSGIGVCFMLCGGLLMSSMSDACPTCAGRVFTQRRSFLGDQRYIVSSQTDKMVEEKKIKNTKNNTDSIAVTNAHIKEGVS